MSSAYNQLLRDAATSVSPLVLTIGGLVAGQTYLFEWMIFHGSVCFELVVELML